MKKFKYLFLLTTTVSFNSFADEYFFKNWLENVSKIQERQPHWMTPLVTVTPRLEQEYRADFSRNYNPGGSEQSNLGGGKGIELISSSNTEVIIGIPNYENQTTTKLSTSGSGFGDENLLFKYRVMSENEENGDYILSIFLGGSIPTGNAIFAPHKANSNPAVIYHDGSITPTIAAGKGWGDRFSGFDIQTTLGITVPSGDVGYIGRTLLWNTSYQGHVGKFWPEVETSYYHYYDGPNAGRNQLLITYGMTLGRFEIDRRVKAIVGMGYQVVQGTDPLNLGHSWLSTFRITF